MCVVELDMAIAYWNIVMKESFRFLEIWCTFLKVRELFMGWFLQAVISSSAVYHSER